MVAMETTKQKIIKRIVSLYPLSFGHSQLFNIIDKFPFEEKENVFYIKSLQCPMYLDPRTYMSRHLYYFGVYEPQVSRLLKKFLEPGMIFYDIGANFGYYSLLASKAVSKEGIVYAFEPQKGCCRFLLKNIKVNKLYNVRLYRCALSDRIEKKKIYQLSRTNVGQASLSRKGLSAFGSENVNCCSIDSLIESKEILPCNAMKIDVEGGELNVLKGAVSHLSNNPPRIIVFEAIEEHLKRFEASIKQVLSFLENFNYIMFFGKRGKWTPFKTFEYYKAKGSPPDFVAILKSSVENDFTKIFK
jgi:FkbM family methyltransferase